MRQLEIMGVALNKLLEDAILYEIEEYKSLNDINIVKYLMQLDLVLVTS
jgi:hypothetical protein